MLQGLKPISGNHSIKNAEAQIFVPQSFVAIEEDFKKFQTVDVFNSFQKKGKIKPTTISINKKGLGVEQSQASGYIFERFESNGSLKDVFRVENINNNNRSVLSLSTRKYSRWNNFKEEQLKLVYQALDELKPYINAVSFTYLDEFDWQGESKIPVYEIFNSKSELLNIKFLDSRNGTLVLISQGLTEEENLITEEKIELSFNNDLRKVQISHQFLVKFKSPVRILKIEDAQSLDKYFDIVHKEHKSFLDHLLTDDCKKLIEFKL
jgi:uncharacterized protein (TIGR04255 family)